ncbi:probable pectinesterase 8 [Setaria viridis]|uniref:probable pectinesterase 8 n=1 Tax=Setaria viridis TaxID=4556 RepID=UPI003B3B8854
MIRAGVAAALVLLLCQLSPTASTACLLPPSFPPPETSSTAVFCVDKSGCCNYTTVQAAVDAIPDNSQKRTIVWINAGIYVEKVTLKKPNVTFQVQGMKATTIVWNDTANFAKGTRNSASVHIDAPGFVAKNISFHNAAPAPKPGTEGAQAVAIRISGDKAAFSGCGFFGAQDTLLDEQHRHYFKECFIEGSVDFIFGDGRSLYENSTLNSVAEELPQGQHSINGAITAQARQFPENNTGFSFVGCTIQGTGWILLGRAWQAYSRVVFAYTYMPGIVASAGWDNWGDERRNRTVFYGEHGCLGDGANVAGRVAYARSVDDSQVRPFLDASYIDGEEWLKPFDDALIA